jgi:hypothetical protein
MASLAVNPKGCMNKPYWQKLQDPRWQKKRLEIMNRAGFKCETCNDDKATLHVHHGYYEKGLELWEYDNATLWCLCAGCHQMTQDAMRDAQYELAKFKPEEICTWVAPWLNEECKWNEGPRLSDLSNEARLHLGKKHDDFVKWMSVAIQHSPMELYDVLLNLYEKAIFEEPRWIEFANANSDKEPGV